MRCYGPCRDRWPRSSPPPGWRRSASPAFRELLGAIGILVPMLVRVAEFLTPAAAVGFAIVMVGAIASHAYLREPRNVAATVAIFIAAVTVAVGRALGG